LSPSSASWFSPTASEERPRTRSPIGVDALPMGAAGALPYHAEQCVHLCAAPTSSGTHRSSQGGLGSPPDRGPNSSARLADRDWPRSATSLHRNCHPTTRQRAGWIGTTGPAKEAEAL